jgi:hypothetical protein
MLVIERLTAAEIRLRSELESRCGAVV